MSNTTKKTTTKSTASKSTTKKAAPKKAETKKVEDNSVDALKKELEAKIAELDRMLAAQRELANAEPVEVEATEGDTEDKYFEEPNPNKKAKVYSMVFGYYTIHCPSRGFTEFKEYGTFKILSYAQLLDYMLTCDTAFKQGRLYIADAQIVEALGLTEYYQELFSIDFVKDIISGNIKDKDFVKKISDSTDKQKESLANYMAILTYEGKFSDYNILNKVSEACGVDISRKVNEMRSFVENSQEE